MRKKISSFFPLIKPVHLEQEFLCFARLENFLIHE